VERAATVIGNGTPEQVKAVKAGEAGPKAALATLEAAVVDTSRRIPQCALGHKLVFKPLARTAFWICGGPEFALEEIGQRSHAARDAQDLGRRGAA
jgi:hypothetical protein